jgi:molecular chaperone GrpE
MGLTMTDRTVRAENEAATEPNDVAGPATPAAASAEHGPEADAAAVLAREAAEFKDKLLRTLAEMENLRRRTEREVADARLYGITNFARDVLGVADNMRRALDAVGPDLRNSADAALKSLLDGVELTERELHKAFEKHGVRKLDPTGEKFDPNLHQAIYEVPDPSVPSGMVAQVVQPGYTLGDRVLRPAMVGVSKGGPKVAPNDRAANENVHDGGSRSN